MAGRTTYKHPHEERLGNPDQGEVKRIDPSKLNVTVYYWTEGNGGAHHIAIHVAPEGSNGTYFSSAVKKFDSAREVVAFNRDCTWYENVNLNTLIARDNGWLTFPAKDPLNKIIKINFPLSNVPYSAAHGKDSFENRFKLYSTEYKKYKLLSNNCGHQTLMALYWAGWLPNKPKKNDFALLPKTVAKRACTLVLSHYEKEKNEILTQKSDSITKIKVLLANELEILKMRDTMSQISLAAKMPSHDIAVLTAVAEEKDFNEICKKLYLAAENTTDKDLRKDLLHFFEALVPADLRVPIMLTTQINKLAAESKKLQQKGHTGDAVEIEGIVTELRELTRGYLSATPNDRMKQFPEFEAACHKTLRKGQEVMVRHKVINRMIAKIANVIAYLGKLMHKSPKLSSHAPFFTHARQSIKLTGIHSSTPFTFRRRGIR